MRGSGKFSAIVQILVMMLPWPVRRALLNALLGFKIDRTATIGFSLLLTNQLVMAKGARIGHANLVRKLEALVMAPHAAIFSRNQATGTLDSAMFPGCKRSSTLRLGEYAALTHHHILDCSDSITIGNHSVLAGYYSQILTHDIDVLNYRLTTGSVVIGDHCYIGSGVIIVKGARVPDCSVIGARSVVRGDLSESHCLLVGAPATKIKKIPSDAAYFSRVN